VNETEDQNQDQRIKKAKEDNIPKKNLRTMSICMYAVHV